MIAAVGSPAFAQQAVKTFPTVPKTPPSKIWKDSDLFGTPKVYPGEETGLQGTDEIKPIFYDGVDYQGKPTRIFAWLGIPKGGGSKVPGIVLVHGGGGTAFRDWVQIWVNRGYAAIAMDLGGEIPAGVAGPVAEKLPNKYMPMAKPFANGKFEPMDVPLADTWFYHAVAAVTRGQSVLAGQPKVDPNKIGLTGSSWGGVLTILGMGVDKRFKFAAPVYGCGFLGENSSWLFRVMQTMAPGQAEKWVEDWDPGQYVGRQTTPVLFLNGTNDLHFRPDSWAKTYQAAKGSVTLCLRVNWGHGHYPDADPKEITVFADSVVKGGDPLAVVTRHGAEKGEAWVQYKDTPKAQIVKAEFNYTTDEGPWEKRRWVVAPAALSRGSNKASAKVPDGVTCYYFNIVDSRNCMVSSPLTIQDKPVPVKVSSAGDMQNPRFIFTRTFGRKIKEDRWGS